MKCANCGQDKYSHPVSPELQCAEFRPMAPLRVQCERIIGLLGEVDQFDDADRDLIATALLRYARQKEERR